MVFNLIEFFPEIVYVKSKSKIVNIGMLDTYVTVVLTRVHWLRSKLGACSPSRLLAITKLLGGC